ncbi:MAG: TRAFs-binding domain-containing protein [Rhodospirillales bacterium]
MAEHSTDVWLKHRAVLALARAGATVLAERKFAELDLAGVAAVDVRALHARILKDRALAQAGPHRKKMLVEAAKAYGEIFRQSRNTYPGVNAASLLLLSGDARAASDLARRVLALLPPAPARPVSGDYYDIATRIEALLVVGDAAEAAELIPLAVAACSKDYGARATTLRQLKLVVAEKRIDPAILQRFAIPRVIHYTGHMIAPPGSAGRFPAEAESAVARRIAAFLDRTPVGWAYGSLAGGADILFVEALLRRGAEVVVVLPFAKDEFIAASVRRGGEGWVGRFEECLRRVQVRYATEDSYLGDSKLFAYAGRFAMGLAVLRARHLQTEAEQVALWDRGAPGGPAGTAVDVRAWRRNGRPCTLIAPTVEDRITARMAAAKPARGKADKPRAARHPCAMLFGDIKNFSKLTDAQMPAFVERVMGGLARVIDRYAKRVLFKNTWGDGVFLVFREAADAANCAIDLQDVANGLDSSKYDLPPGMAMRMGGHLGPIFEGRDPIRHVRNFYGAHVSRAARVEPVTPEGCVYVTESFAAALAMDRRAAFDCDYVGMTEAAKKYGAMRMFLLRRTPSRKR